MFPWPVTMVVKFCVRFIFVCSLSATFGKYSLCMYVCTCVLCMCVYLYVSKYVYIFYFILYMVYCLLHYFTIVTLQAYY